MDLGLQGKRVLVTGGASGMGAQLCRKLVAEGARVVINYRSREDEARKLVEELGADNAVAIRADLAVRTEIDELFDGAAKWFGGLDILVNNAGLWLTCKIGEITDDDWDRSMDVNIYSALMLSQRFIVAAKEAGRSGRILNVTSQAAFFGSSTGHIPYAIGKAGMVALTRSLANELGSCGITVNALAIGTMESPMIAEALETRREFYEARIPVGRLATASEVADVAAFLVSERSNYMTGATVDVSGGQLRH
ncbi:SDR family NAD(P)-dependent oxidoreductase [Ancrocorticia populi]|uniref:SDR family NAD(P)-dependent oxidoreductase n=1 Tax=Ancrocorticia populi TaxID=2175228 RepID=UPI003F918D4F